MRYFRVAASCTWFRRFAKSVQFAMLGLSEGEEGGNPMAKYKISRVR